MKFLAEDFHCPKLVACLKAVNYQAIFKNGIHARFLGKLTQYAVIMLRQNVDQYFQGSRTINPLKPSFSCMMAHILHCFGDSVKDKERGRCRAIDRNNLYFRILLSKFRWEIPPSRTTHMNIHAPLFFRCLNGFFPFLLPRLLRLGCKADIVEKKKESDRPNSFFRAYLLSRRGRRAL